MGSRGGGAYCGVGGEWLSKKCRWINLGHGGRVGGSRESQFTLFAWWSKYSCVNNKLTGVLAIGVLMDCSQALVLHQNEQ